jgi:PAS domain S-box-containing protein
MMALPAARRPTRPGLGASQPVARRVALIVLLFVAIVGCLLLLVAAQMDILSAIRAYVGGEGLWSKGQKDAVQHLVRYAETHDEEQYLRYRRAIAVPLGDRQARLELEKPSPDMAVVRDGFVRGRNHPDDVAEMARLFRRFRNVSFIDKAIGLWTAGDRYIARVDAYARQLHDEIAGGRSDPARVAGILAQVHLLNQRLTALESAFSQTLGKGARATKRLLLRATYIITGLLVSIGLLVSWMLLRHLRGWEAKYRRLLETATDAILVAERRSGVVVEANRRAAELFGIPVERLVGMRQAELFADEHEAHRLFDEQLRVGATGYAELDVRRADRRMVPVELSAGVTNLGGVAVVQSILRDVTERRRVEAALRESEERYRGLLENANDVVYTHDLEGNFTSFNKAAEQLTGYRRDEACRLNLVDLVAPEDVARARSMGSRDATGVYELRIRTKTDQVVPLEVSTRVVEHNGIAIGVQGIGRDITERKRAEHERAALLVRERAARTEAELANRAKDEFLATLSHELRTPLAAILIWSRLLKAGRLDDQKRARALDVIERNTKLQAQLIEDLLDVSRIVTGKLHLDKTEVDLGSVIEVAIDSVRTAADAKGVRLETDVDPAVGFVVGDRMRLQQIVWNLVANAIKFTPGSGRVTVGLKRDERRVVLRVEDTGVGIAPDFLPHVFERFRQADATSTRAHAGLGLGLAIVRHLVELHGGTVAASSPGTDRGATFTVALPILHQPLQDEAAEIAAADAAWRAAPSLAGVEVLLIDDEPDARESVAAVLEERGARVTIAGSAQEGIEAFDRDPPDVVLCDLGMPAEDGYAFLRQLQSRPDPPPAAALTAYARDDDRSRTLAAGFQTHLAKPVEPAELISAVATLAALGGVERRRPRRSLSRA